MVTRASDATEDLATMAGAAVLGSLIIPGRPENVRDARSFAAATLGQLGAVTDTAVLLTSELVTNAIRHSRSRSVGGTVGLVILRVPGGLRIEVTDQGSDVSSPMVKGDSYASDGHGLFLVETMAEQWGYLRRTRGTTVWFRLADPQAGRDPSGRPADYPVARPQ
jgi:anti-sigma regulatory factor (Ser/Thr protein kinase)